MIKSKSLLTVLFLVVAVLVALPANADSLKDVFSLQSKEYEQHFKDKNAKALACQWTESGMLITFDGTICRGRKEIEQYFKDTFSELQDISVDVETTLLQSVSPTVAIEKGTTAKGGYKPSRQYTAVHVKGADGWKMAWVEEKPIEFPFSIEDMFWMLGTWKSQPADGEGITFNIEKIQDGKFIQSTSGEKGGRQVIGYDPAVNRLVSWHFDSRGGFGKGEWERVNNAWRQAVEGTMPDGTLFSAMYTMTPLDKDSFLLESSGRYIGNIRLPNAKSLKFVRVSKE